MKYRQSLTGILCVMSVFYFGVIWADKIKMPMRFEPDADPVKVLQSYPLGSMNKLAVLSHHGKADKEIRMPNGREGWVYDMSLHRIPKVYMTPDGEKQVVEEREKAGIQQIYTLIFGNDGYVIDVIYQGQRTGMSALQMQHTNMMKH